MTVFRNATPAALELYRGVLGVVQPLGAFAEEVKKTSVHLVHASAFAGVHFRRDYLIVTIRSAAPIVSPRVVKIEQISRNRWHCDVKLSSGAELDSELVGWLRAAYELCGPRAGQST